MNTEVSSAEILMIVASWYLRKEKPCAGWNFPLKGHGNSQYIILRFATE